MPRRETQLQRLFGTLEPDKDKKLSYGVTKISLIFIIFASIYLTFVITQFTQSEDAVLLELAGYAQTAILLFLVGLVALFLILTVGRDKVEFRTVDIIGTKYFGNVIFPAIIGLAGIIILNMFVFQFEGNYNLTGFNYLLFSVSMAIVEEVIFTFLFQITFTYLLNSRIWGALIRAIGFVIYHLAVYGQEQNRLIAVLAGGFIMAGVFEWANGDITANMIIHLAINIMASGFTFTIGG
jgi:hypothetical protein